jgi:hypothetical protein
LPFNNSINKIFSVVVAVSFMLQGNLACLAADVSNASKPAVPLWQEQAMAVRPSSESATAITPHFGVLQDALPASVKDSDNNASASIKLSTAAGITQPLSRSSNVADDTYIDNEDTALGSADNHTILKSPLLLTSSQAADNPQLLAANQPAEGFVLSGGASVSPDQAPGRIDQLSKRIMLKEIELERFNLNYTHQVAIQGRWKGWRYTGLQEVNSAMGLAGAFISVAYRGARLEDAKSVKPCIQESANYVSMIGSYVGAGAAAMEFGINGIHDMVARHRGYGPAESLRKVSRLKDEIDKMIAERDSMIRVEATLAALAGQTELDRAEGKVLEDMLDESLYEFERFHVGARKVIAFQQTQYILDCSKYIVNSLAYQFSYLSLHDHHRRYNGNAGALFIASGGIYIGAPIVSRMVGASWATLTRQATECALGHSYKASAANLTADLARLDQLAKQTRISNNSERLAARATERMAHYEGHEKTYTNEIRAAEKAKNKAVLTATENIAASIYVGGSKVASGVFFGICGFNHVYNAGSKSIEADRVTNDDLFAASVIAIPATAFSMLDSLRIQVKGEIARHKLAAKGALTEQIVTKRLAQLDALEKSLNSI